MHLFCSVFSLFQDLCSCCTVENPVCWELVEMSKGPLPVVGNLGSMKIVSENLCPLSDLNASMEPVSLAPELYLRCQFSFSA